MKARDALYKINVSKRRTVISERKGAHSVIFRYKMSGVRNHFIVPKTILNFFLSRPKKFQFPLPLPGDSCRKKLIL
jgi:hypothetical protein